MLLYTYIARSSDGLPLVASVEEHKTNLDEQKKQLKAIVGKISGSSTPRASIASGRFMLHYLLDEDYQVIFMCITEAKFPQKLVFTYLDELRKEFVTSYGTEAQKLTTRAFQFAQFDTYIQKTKRIYQDSRASQNLDRLNADLQDVQKVMTKNIEDLLYRGDSLDKMSDLSSSLRSESKKYRRAARRVNVEAMLRQYAPITGIVFIVLFIIWWRFF